MESDFNIVSKCGQTRDSSGHKTGGGKKIWLMQLSKRWSSEKPNPNGRHCAVMNKNDHLSRYRFHDWRDSRQRSQLNSRLLEKSESVGELPRRGVLCVCNTPNAQLSSDVRSWSLGAREIKCGNYNTKTKLVQAKLLIWPHPRVKRCFSVLWLEPIV